jgi:hypothetical protein
MTLFGLFIMDNEMVHNLIESRVKDYYECNI